ncbi:17-beta-hydroxysteroid dehydrogenase type 6-like [Mizuhopecten yessoensis]|uniref:17-beta-hydroxysteroid dehydrogenase type 6 n=1 Tax=Mizuhopecten yessoensis TaxID=6573 RepID=A0A210PFG1_MIZYE|nr:17-beta-hydroxysteroid dehydrogenase type 6-like [Mizuhopecten yessoensis]OWF35222.1 17-beta-hydroxysteroid dehydrogenase type 6 [Mizuhopecten yessoensis]
MKRLAGLVLLVLGLGIYFNQQSVLCTTVLSKPLYAAVFYAVLGLTAVYLLTSRSPKLCVCPTGKAVIITGCDSGFGNSLARRLDKLGFKVFAGCLAPDRKGATQLEEDSGGRIQVVELNVTDDQHVRCAVRFVKQNLGDHTLWACVNNAGIAVFQEIEWCSVIQFQQIMDVNVIGVVRVTKAFLPLIRASKGRVVNVASLAGRFTVPSFAAYSMSKKACIAFSDGLRQEMNKFDIKVITVEPGLYKTPIAATDYLIDTNRKSWAETPTEVKDVYGEEYFDAFLKNIEGQMKRARSNVEEVVDQMVEAVTTKEPHVRYVPNFMSNVRASILMYLPTSITDRFFESIYKIKVDVKKAT